MNFHLNIHCDSAAFYDETYPEDVKTPTEGDSYKPGPELARILRHVADQLGGHQPIPDYGTDYQTIFDVNGNDVGRFALKPEGS